MKEEEFFYQEFGHMPPEVQKEKWRALLLYVLRDANVVEFIIDSPNSLPLSLEPFRSNLIKIFSSYWRYGSRRRRPVIYARFALSNELKDFLLNSTIGKWGEEYPEDPAFYKDDMLLMWTIAHEYVVFVRISDREAEKLNKESFSLEKVKVSPPYPLH